MNHDMQSVYPKNGRNQPKKGLQVQQSFPSFLAKFLAYLLMPIFWADSWVPKIWFRVIQFIISTICTIVIMIQILIKRIHYKCQTGCRRYITKVHQECKKIVPRLFFFLFPRGIFKNSTKYTYTNSEKSSLKLISHERKTYIISKVNKLVKPCQIRAKLYNL